jgi:hypothetical protein
MSAIIHLLKHYISTGLAYVFSMVHVEDEIGSAFRA